MQSTQREIILHDLREVTSERQVISNFPSVTSMVLMVWNGRKCITYIYHIIKQLLAYVSVDMECYWTVNSIILTSAQHWPIKLLLLNNTPCPPQHKSIIVKYNHRSLKLGPYITSIASKPKAHNSNDIVSFWFWGYISDIWTELRAPVI